MIGHIFKALFRPNEAEMPADNAESIQRIYFEKLVAQLGECPACQQGFTEHQIAQFTATTTENQARLEEYIEALKQRDWQKARAYENWDLTKDLLCAQVINCPTGKGVLLLIDDPYELFFNARLMSSEVLSPEESLALNQFIKAEQWTVLHAN